ncbi:LORF2 protein, partial [Crocuta crocuta]
VSRIYKELLQLNKKKINNFSNRPGSELTVVQRKYTSGQSVHETILASLAIRETQIKKTRRYCFTPTSTANIKKANNEECCRGYGESETFIHCWSKCKMTQPL